MLGLKRRGTTAHGHHLYGILAYHCNPMHRIQVDRKHIVIILEEHDSLARNPSRSVIMFRRTQRTIRLVPVH